VGEELFKQADHLSQETSLSVTGAVRADSRAPGGYEIDATGFAVHSEAHDFPITPKEHGVDFLLDRRHLWIRSPRQQAILRVRHEVINAVRDYFNERDFILADTPVFTPAACEGTTTLFPVQYFEDTTAYLTQSGQLYNEANAMALGRVYCFGPTFRAEKSKTRRHLTEFWMVEPEVAYATLDDVIDLAEGLVVHVVSRVLDRRQRELKTLERNTSKLEQVKAPFPRVSYDDAAKILVEKGQPFQYGTDLGGSDETVLSEQFDRPIAVHRYPAAIKAFYMKPDPVQPDKALCVDVLAPGATARSSAEASVSTTTSCCCSASTSTSCRARRSSGTSTSASTDRCRTAASAWASSASSRGSADWNTFGKRFPIRACCTGFTRSLESAVR
jgi:asparaginyl-tRNA synthetase